MSLLNTASTLLRGSERSKTSPATADMDITVRISCTTIHRPIFCVEGEFDFHRHDQLSNCVQGALGRKLYHVRTASGLIRLLAHDLEQLVVEGGANARVLLLVLRHGPSFHFVQIFLRDQSRTANLLLFQHFHGGLVALLLNCCEKPLIENERRIERERKRGRERQRQRQGERERQTHRHTDTQIERSEARRSDLELAPEKKVVLYGIQENSHCDKVESNRLWYTHKEYEK